MFDPIQSLLASLIVEGIKGLVEFLKLKGLPVPEVDGWLAAFAVAIAAFAVSLGDVLAGRLPPTLQTALTFAVKFLLTLLTMLGFHALVIRPVKNLSAAFWAFADQYWQEQ